MDDYQVEYYVMRSIYPLACQLPMISSVERRREKISTQIGIPKSTRYLSTLPIYFIISHVSFPIVFLATITEAGSTKQFKSIAQCCGDKELVK